jgi:hypothetical protein
VKPCSIAYRVRPSETIPKLHSLATADAPSIPAERANRQADVAKILGANEGLYAEKSVMKSSGNRRTQGRSLLDGLEETRMLL